MRLPTQWLGVAPFFIFAIMFLILPTLYLMLGAFQNDAGEFTFENIAALAQPSIVAAYWISIKVSLASSLIGAFAGLAIAIAIVRGGLPDWIRSATLTFSGVASNFAGVPLAFAFLATLGRLGLATVLLNTLFGLNIYAHGFNILSFWGLTLTYVYFQIPLMVVIIVPAIDGLKKEWGEAAATLGATMSQYWRMVVIPVIWPSFLGTVILLFANAFGAIATAYALTGSSLNIVPILLYAQIRGDVLHNAASRLCHRLRHDRHHRACQRLLHLVPHPLREVAQMKAGRFWAWVVFALGAAYFFIPLIATVEFSHAHAARRLFLRRLQGRAGRRTLPGDLRLFGARRRLHHHPRRAHRGAGCLLDPAAPAAAQAGRRVHHAAAAGHPGHRHRLRLYQNVWLEFAAAVPGDRHGHQRLAGHRLCDTGAALYVSRRRYRVCAPSTCAR